MPISRITGASIEDGSITLADLGITTIDSGTGNTLTLQANSRTGITIDVTGNTAIANTLTLSSTGARIRGDFSNATIVSRVMFQNSVANGVSYIHTLPNGTATQSGLLAFNNSDTTNASFFQLGAVATDIRLFSSFLGSGTYLPITMWTGGSERLRIDTSGNMMLGVTTASSSTKFDVYGNSSAAHIGARVTNAATDGYSTLWLSSSNDGLVRGGSTAAAFTSELAMLTSGSIPLTFYTANTKRMTVGATGNIGIGTTSPSQLLHVAAGTILSSNTAGTIATVSIAGNGSTVGTSDFALQQGTSSEAYVYNRANSYLVIGTNNAERIRIASNGYLTHYGPDSSWYSNATANATRLDIIPSNGAVTYRAFAIGTDATPAQIWNTQGTERMRITSAGNVGIGTSSPSTTLDVASSVGTVRVSSTTTTSTTYFTAVNAAGNFYIGRDSSTGGNFGTAYAAVLFSEGAYPMTFYTTSLERMRITSTGNVGIGTTNPGAKLDVIGTTFFRGTAGGRTLNISEGSTSTIGFLIESDTNAGDLTLSSAYSAGFIAFKTAGSERMRIDSAGDVGIGTTNPVYQLHIQSGDPRIALTNTTYGEWFTSAGWTGANDYSIVQAGTAERMRLDSSGNLRFNSGYGSVATAYGCRAWVNFNGTGVVAIRGSGNVSSITDNGIGDYTINLTNAMPDTNYGAIGMCQAAIGAAYNRNMAGPCYAAPTTSTFRVQCSDAGTKEDPTFAYISFYR